MEVPGSIRENEEDQESYVAKLSQSIVKFININYHQNGKIPVNLEPVVEDLGKKKKDQPSQDNGTKVGEDKGTLVGNNETVPTEDRLVSDNNLTMSSGTLFTNHTLSNQTSSQNDT